MVPNGKMETPRTPFQKRFLFIGTVHNLKIGHTSQRHANGRVPCHRSFYNSQSFLHVSSPCPLKSFCLFNAKNACEPVLCLLLLCRICNGENVSLTPDRAFHQPLLSLANVINDLFIFLSGPTSSRCLRVSTIPCLSQG